MATMYVSPRKELPDICNKPFLIAAAPHCGTRYMADVLKNLGFNVGHERINESYIGTVSSIDIGRIHHFSGVLLQTRHPYGFLGSCTRNGYFTDRMRTWRPQGWACWIKDNPIPARGVTHPLKILSLWYRYYVYMEENADIIYTYKIEDIKSDSPVLLEVLSRLKLKPNKTQIIPWDPLKHSTSDRLKAPNERKPFRWDIDCIVEEIRSLYPGKKEWFNLAELIKAKAETYGYEL